MQEVLFIVSLNELINKVMRLNVLKNEIKLCQGRGTVGGPGLDPPTSLCPSVQHHLCTLYRPGTQQSKPILSMKARAGNLLLFLVL